MPASGSAASKISEPAVTRIGPGQRATTAPTRRQRRAVIDGRGSRNPRRTATAISAGVSVSAAINATENNDTSTSPDIPSAATTGRATASARPTDVNGIAAATGDRYTTSSNSRISPTVAAVIESICRSIAANSSTIVAPGP